MRQTTNCISQCRCCPPGRRCALSLLLLLLCGCSGFGTSRWAMDDPVYAEKYGHAYSGNDADKAARMMKQSIDARHVEGRGACYVGLSAADDPGALGAEIGVSAFPTAWSEARVGLKGLAGTGAEDWFVGGDLGFRVHSPTRLSPFAGVGTFIGANNRRVSARGDGRDNDGNGFIDELGETKSDARGLASFYPEAGVHYWLNGSSRVSAGAQYHFTTDGRDSDFWFFGLQLVLLGDKPGFTKEPEYTPLTESEH